MIEGIAIGFGTGVAIMFGVAALGMRAMMKHPEIIAKQVGKKMAAGMRKEREQRKQMPARETIP